MKKIFNIKISILIMITIPIISIMIGYFGVKYYLLSNNKFSDVIIEENSSRVENVIGSDKVNEKELKDKIIVSFEELSFYSIQMGSFSEEENAIAFSNKLSSDNIYSFYVKENNYIVYSFASNNKDSLRENLEICKKEIEDSFIKKISIKGNDISYYSDNDNNMTNIIENISNHFNNVLTKEYNIQIETERLNNIKEDIKNIVADATENKSIGNKLTNFLNELITIKDSYLNATPINTDKYIVNFIKLYIKYYVI